MRHVVKRLAPALIGTAAICGTGLAADDDLFADPELHQFKIEIPAAELEMLRRDNRSYVRAGVTADGRKLSDVGVRLKGVGSFRPLEDRPSLAMKFDQFTPGQRFRGLTKLMLNNSVQDTTLLSEYLAAGLFREAGVPAARVTHARVSLNGRDLGFYVAIEAMNKAFLGRHFSDPNGNLYEAYARDLDQRLDQDSGEPGDQSDLRALLEAARSPVETRLAALRRVLDLERFVSFLAVTMLIAQHDSYPLNRNNYRLYNDPASGRLVMIPHGIDGTFSRINMPIRPPPKYILARALMEIPEGMELYSRRVGTLFADIFKLDEVNRRLEGAGKRLAQAAADDSERASNAARTASFQRRVAERHESVSKQFAGMDVTPLVLAIGVNLLLSDWSPEVGSGTATLARTGKADEEALHIKAAGADTTASWRKTLILAPGAYRFGGRARVAILRPARTEPGAALRISGDRAARRVTSALAWTPLEHAFTVREGEEDVQLVCELRAGVGEAWFESASLVLRREVDER